MIMNENSHRTRLKERLLKCNVRNIYSSNLRRKLVWHPELQMRMISTNSAKTDCIQSRFDVSLNCKIYRGRNQKQKRKEIQKERRRRVTYNEDNPIGMYILVCSIWIAGCQLEACCKPLLKIIYCNRVKCSTPCMHTM